MSEVSDISPVHGKLPKMYSIIHLAIHAVAVGLALAVILGPLATRLNFAAMVALVFAIGMLVSYPTMMILLDAKTLRRPTLVRWITVVAVGAVIIYAASQLVAPAL